MNQFQHFIDAYMFLYVRTSIAFPVGGSESMINLFTDKTNEIFIHFAVYVVFVNNCHNEINIIPMK
jgi:hypothetical protein